MAGAFSVGVATPNPASNRTEIAVTLAEAQTVRVVVLDMLGREVAVVTDGPMEAGTHRSALTVNGLAPGAYLVRVTSGSVVETRRLTVIR